MRLKNILVTKPENVRYLSGFNGSFGELILTPKKKFLITDSRYSIVAKKMCLDDVEIIIIKDYVEDLNATFKRLGIKSIGFESKDFSYSKYLNCKKYFKSIKFCPIKNEIDELRMVKTEQEIKLIENSQKLNEKVLLSVQKLIKPGVSELEIANKIKIIGSEFGAEKVSFDPIVAFGKNSASPHYNPSNYRLKSNEIVLIDMGFILKGYCSDMTRTFLPQHPTSEMQKMYNLVLEAQLNCIKNIKAGISGIQADALSRSIFKKNGVADNFTHSNGHGIGLEIHEAPSLSLKTKHADRKIKLQKNMVVTVEPGLYFEGKFGIRIEDIIVIEGNNDGSARNLTSFAK
jgi:Xaa-Pro aminopeptidase